jgi:phage gpG-like protein
MKEFTLLGFVGLLGTLRLEMDHANHAALDRAGQIVRDEAQRVIGTYDYNWTPLAPSTLARKAADTPLLETAEMRASIEYRADHTTAEIGSELDKAVWHELGTVRIPPRPFLRGAMEHEAHHVVDTIGRVITAHLAGQPIPTNILPRP